MTPCRICSALPIPVELADPNLVKHPEPEAHPCPRCGGQGWTCEPACCRRSEWECGGRGCTGPEPEQVQCEYCQGTGVGMVDECPRSGFEGTVQQWEEVMKEKINDER